MELKRARLRWLTVLAPVAFILLLVSFYTSTEPHSLQEWIADLLLALGLGLAAAYPFSYFVFSRIQRQEEEIVRRSEAMAAISAIGTGITDLLDLEKTLHSVVERAGQLLDAEVSVLCLTDERGRLAPKATIGPPEAFGVGMEKPDQPDGEAGCVPRPMLSTGPSQEDLRCCGIKEGFIKAHLAAPLRREGKVIGALCVAERSPRQFTALEVELLNALATQAGIALENARLHEQLQSMALTEERHRIAREMHDGLAQDLGYLYMKFGQVEQMLTSKEAARSIAELKEMKKVAREAYEEVRQSILGLRSMVSRSLGLVPTLVEYLGHFENQAGIGVEMKIVDEEAARFPPRVEIQLIRIIQEALANVRKHSEAKRAWVTFSAEGEFAKILIQDDGVGFDLEAQRRSPRPFFGLETMRERAEGIGGTFAITTAPGQGTTVEVRLPFGR